MTNDTGMQPSDAYAKQYRWAMQMCPKQSEVDGQRKGEQLLNGSCAVCDPSSWHCRRMNPFLPLPTRPTAEDKEKVLDAPTQSEATRHNSGKPKLSLIPPCVWRELLAGESAVESTSEVAVDAVVAIAEIAHGKLTDQSIPTILRGCRHFQLEEGSGNMLYDTECLTAAAMEFGVTKYGRNNWKLGFPLTTLCDSALRHLLKLVHQVSQNDDESGVSHVGHIMFFVVNVIYMMENDDLIERFDDSGALKYYKERMK